MKKIILFTNEMEAKPPTHHKKGGNFMNDSLTFDSAKLLSRIKIPIFSGDKGNYESWKSAFLACVDNTTATPEYKLLRLLNSLQGEPLKFIERLGHSAAAYNIAKEWLERKYGGQRRQIALSPALRLVFGVCLPHTVVTNVLGAVLVAWMAANPHDRLLHESKTTTSAHVIDKSTEEQKPPDMNNNHNGENPRTHTSLTMVSESDSHSL